MKNTDLLLLEHQHGPDRHPQIGEKAGEALDQVEEVDHAHFSRVLMIVLGIAEALDERELTNKERAIIDYVQEKFRQAGACCSIPSTSVRLTPCRAGSRC